jgi:CheY-like chemotaxis protein
MVAQQTTSFDPTTQEYEPVLIVEDETVTRRAMTRLLAALGYRPQAFESAEEALLRLSSQKPPRIALVDLDLPGMNGLELISRLDRMDPSIFPILITGTDQQNLAARLGGRNVTYLRKPLNLEALLSLLAVRSGHDS